MDSNTGEVQSPDVESHTQSVDYKPIEHYGIIGDLETAALVGIDGSIDWCCLPHFDSPSVFAALLDARKGGFFKIAPAHTAVHKQMYLPQTNVLVTRFLNPDGVGEVIDFMPIYPSGAFPHAHQIVRQVRVVRGCMPFTLECFPAFDYGRAKHALELVPGGAVFEAGGERLGLTCSLKLSGRADGLDTEFVMRVGDKLTFLPRYADADSALPLIDPELDGELAFEATVAFWRSWVGGISYRGRWHEMIERSALTLKLLTFAPTGATGWPGVLRDLLHVYQRARHAPPVPNRPQLHLPRPPKRATPFLSRLSLNVITEITKKE